MTVTWGDGSGTGAEGTFNLTSPSISSDLTTLSIWKGVWAVQVSSFSSNWKELRTLLHTLEHEKKLGGERVKGRRVLYFTDNMVSYDVFRRGSSKSTPLWTLFLKINLLELELQCVLQVIHVPGTTMIEQGTAGLSRGLICKLWDHMEVTVLYPFCGVPLLPLLNFYNKLSLYFLIVIPPILYGFSRQIRVTGLDLPR